MSEKLKINLILELRKYGITDKAVLATIEKIPREDFIDKELFFKAYKNDALPISCNQTISQPAVVAKMTELLEPKKSFKVLFNELKSHNNKVVKKPSLILLTKSDTIDVNQLDIDESINELIMLPISSINKDGIKKAISLIANLIK